VQKLEHELEVVFAAMGLKFARARTWVDFFDELGGGVDPLSYLVPLRLRK